MELSPSHATTIQEVGNDADKQTPSHFPKSDTGKNELVRASGSLKLQPKEHLVQEII